MYAQTNSSACLDLHALDTSNENIYTLNRKITEHQRAQASLSSQSEALQKWEG